tara:strand:+ start:1316 stop:1582 length:267 start_codon:yes stop_codon:yes gene_type:complete
MLFVKNKIIIFVFLLVLFLVSFFSIKLWINLDFINISSHGIFAILICIVMSLIIGSGLMALAFFSAKHGYDENVDHDLESLIDKYKKL